MLQIQPIGIVKAVFQALFVAIKLLRGCFATVILLDFLNYHTVDRGFSNLLSAETAFELHYLK
jgi:hypothetical protein